MDNLVNKIQKFLIYVFYKYIKIKISSGKRKIR